MELSPPAPAAASAPAFVYMLQCKDDSLYTGWTTDMAKRLRTHNLGRGSRYTRARLPVTLVYLEACSSQREARQREVALKRLTRQAKLAMLQP